MEKTITNNAGDVISLGQYLLLDSALHRFLGCLPFARTIQVKIVGVSIK